MDFSKCVELLAARPADAHAHCEHAKDDAGDVEAAAQQVEALALDGTDGEREIRELSALELVRSFLRLQEERVRIYADFQKGFEAHKKTPGFQDFSGGITRRFASVSEQVNAVEEVLKTERKQPAIAQLIRKIQLEEKEKLLLTSALLIEKMRLEDAASETEPDESAVAFLERSVATLTNKSTKCIERINELLEDVRCEMADLDDE